MNIRAAQRCFSAALAGVSPTPDLDVQYFLEALLSLSSAQLILHGDNALTSSQEHQLAAWVKARQEGRPVAYLLGHQPFWNLDFLVSEETLIPRPETEALVEWILCHAPEDPPKKLVDLGTGTGAIALSLAASRPQWQVDAVDISACALQVAKKNRAGLGLHAVRFYQGDWFDPLPSADYDVIVSNPPYLASDDVHLPSLCYEPTTALVAAEHGLADLFYLADQAIHYLKPGGVLVLEHGYQQQAVLLQHFASKAWVGVKGHCDLLGHPRFVTAHKKGT